MSSDLVLVANAGDGTIGAFALDLTAGQLTPLTTSPVGRGCSTFAIDPDRNLVYAAAKPASPGTPGTPGAAPGIDTFALNRQTGALTHRQHTPTEGGMNYLALSPSASPGAPSPGALRSQVLAGAAYHEGFAATWSIAPDGTLGPMVSRVDWPNAHCVVATDTQLYVVSLGADVIAQYALAPDGTLTPLNPPTAPAPPGSGPRHLILAADGAHGYLVTEFSGQVLSYARDPKSGALTLRGAQSAHASDRDLTPGSYGVDAPTGHHIWGADLHLARRGTLVLASERTESTLAALPVQPNGLAGPTLALVDVVRQPRGFAVSSDGRYAVVAGEADTDLDLLAIGPDGSLTSLGRTPTGARANWVRTLPRA